MRLLQMQKGNVINEESPSAMADTLAVQNQQSNCEIGGSSSFSSGIDRNNESRCEGGNSSGREASMKRKELFGTQASIKKSFKYFTDKPRLNLIDKRLLLGIF